MKRNFNKIIAIIIGEFLCAFAITYFFIPHKLLSGGVGGASILLQYLTGISTGIFIFLINIPLFILGFKKLSKDFMIYTFISANLLSVLLLFFNYLNFKFYIEDILLSAIFGGVINGIGMGIMFRNSTSQGGLDIIAIITKKELNMNISTVLMGMNFIIITIASIIFGIEKGMYTLISMYIGYIFVDKIVTGLDIKKQIMIISDKSEEISQRIIVNPHRGVTLLHAKGAFTGLEKEVIYCVANNRDVVKIKSIVEEIDKKSFISISNMTEVKGKGFGESDLF